MERDNLVLEKSKKFAVRVIKFYKYLCEEKKEYILAKQILRSGTSIGANAREASKAQSKKEFIAKMNTSLKESEETCYWLEILVEAEIIDTKEFESLYSDANELVAILTSIIKSSNSNQ
ncbi:MAG: four helix bundle protein [Clostridia bacterium]|nr:four helix bundle protein [Clostridia bacterium]